MIVTAQKQNNGIFIPFAQLKSLLDKDFTEIQLDIKIVSYKNDLISKTSGLLSNYKIDGLKYENKLRKEWDTNI